MRAEVAEAMAEIQALGLGNPSSTHAAGRRARRLLDDARDELAAAVGAAPAEIVFTSGGTEADDLAVSGVAACRAGAVLCSAVEHDAVLEAVRHLGGGTVAVDARGRLSLEDLERKVELAAEGDGVALVSVMLVNNENGVRQPLDEVVDVVRRVAPGTPVHTDAVQAAPWLDLAVAAAPADLVSISAHKIGGPVGVGALVVRAGTPLAPRLRGGGQERERRSGTQNVVGAVALARAVSLAAAERAEATVRVTALRNRLADGICSVSGGVVEPASPEHAGRSGIVGGTVQLCVAGVESEALLFLLDEAGVEASAGSACAAGALERSHVLTAMGVGDALAAGALRVSVGRTTTEADVDAAIRIIGESIARLRAAGAARRQASDRAEHAVSAA